MAQQQPENVKLGLRLALQRGEHTCVCHVWQTGANKPTWSAVTSLQVLMKW